jgi:hypothetical protein
MSISRNRQRATDQFWNDVKELLTQKYHNPDVAAQKGIDDYLQEIARRNLDGVIYNQGEEQAAKVIDSVIRHGLPTPTSP